MEKQNGSLDVYERVSYTSLKQKAGFYGGLTKWGIKVMMLIALLRW